MIKLLFLLFKKQFLTLCQREQSKKRTGFEKLKFAFTDSNGMKYYKYIDEFDIPLMRKAEIQVGLAHLDMGMSKKELHSQLNVIETAINSGRKPDFVMIGHTVREIKAREDMIIHPEIMMELVSLMYVREDENPAEVDNDIQEAKIKQFIKDGKDLLYVFFYSAGLSESIPYLTKLEKDWKQYWEQSKATIKALEQQGKQFTLEQNSTN